MDKSLHHKAKLEVATVIENLLKGLEIDSLSLTDIYSQITEPPNLKMGHFAFPCFSLAKQLKKGPPQISNELAEKLTNTHGTLFEKAIATGPYLNFFLNYKNFSKYIFYEIDSRNYFSTPLFSNAPKTMIEYFQPNTHKEVHVGHLRNLSLGEAVIHLHKYCGYPIITCTYPGDSGTHVAKVIWYLKNYNPDIPKDVESGKVDRGEWLGSIYSEGNKLLEDQRGTDKEENNKEQLTEILKQIHDGSGEYFDLWKETREWSLDHMKTITDWAGVEFDQWYFESEVDSTSLEYVKKLYDQGILTKDDGAIGMDLKEEKLGFCLLIKSDGNGLYATKDVELARKKFEESGVQKSIYVVDKRQSYHFKQVFKTLEKIGFDQAKDCYHLEYEFVTLPDGAMSSRKGNIISARTLIAEMQSLIKKKYLNRYQDWSDEEKDKTAYAVSLGAIKYGMLSVENNKEIVFDMDAWLKLDGESGPYIQYAYARIQSLIEKVGLEKMQEGDFDLFEKETEKELLYRLGQFNSVVEVACEQYKIGTLCAYLYDLSKLYSSFYAECPVGNADSEGLKRLRSHLSDKTAKVLKEGLALLGIPTTNRM